MIQPTLTRDEVKVWTSIGYRQWVLHWQAVRCAGATSSTHIGLPASPKRCHWLLGLISRPAFHQRITVGRAPPEEWICPSCQLKSLEEEDQDFRFQVSLHHGFTVQWDGYSHRWLHASLPVMIHSAMPLHRLRDYRMVHKGEGLHNPDSDILSMT